jgi:(p)ppGpp synthase/HD superfamily hydrolase
VAAPVTRLGGRQASAEAFIAEAYDGVRTPPGKGLPHAHAVVGVLRDNGYDEVVQLVGLLHDVIEDTPRDAGDVRAAFGAEVAGMVSTLSEDEAITRYGPRKRALREAIAAAGPPLVDVALADKIAILRHAQASGARVPKRKLGHYRATLALALEAGVAPGLCSQLAELVESTEP